MDCEREQKPLYELYEVYPDVELPDDELKNNIAGNCQDLDGYSEHVKMGK